MINVSVQVSRDQTLLRLNHKWSTFWISFIFSELCILCLCISKTITDNPLLRGGWKCQNRTTVSTTVGNKTCKNSSYKHIVGNFPSFL